MESPAIGIGSTASTSYTVSRNCQSAPVSRTTSLTHLSGDSGREVSHVPTSSRNKQASGLHGLSKAAKSDSTGSISSRVLENGQLLAASTASDKSNCVYISQGSLERTVSDVTLLENEHSSSSDDLSRAVALSDNELTLSLPAGNAVKVRHVNQQKVTPKIGNVVGLLKNIGKAAGTALLCTVKGGFTVVHFFFGDAEVFPSKGARRVTGSSSGASWRDSGDASTVLQRGSGGASTGFIKAGLKIAGHGEV
ncbi:hypothetical protein [Candidatus Regiella endosymbiont of Tuberolachnus salignus]|uniref:hypothetical protein n=1 Tax=Candidatus Regiella endosymbiont of Tuberolachnus salignus TaxID=3077956 RepID=UPI0030CB6AAF